MTLTKSYCSRNRGISLSQTVPFFNIGFHEGYVFFIVGSDNKFDVKESQQRRNEDDSFMS
jgi:hypothetical protein